jgi:hypothetical protein
MHFDTGLDALSVTYGRTRTFPGLIVGCYCGKLNDLTVDRSWITEQRHIYTCFRRHHRQEHGLVDLCFLCSEWIFGATQWNDHCQTHLNQQESVPMQCDPLTYGGALATAGYCPFCLGNAKLPASRRMQQFLERDPWTSHVRGHVDGLGDVDSVRCPHPGSQCDTTFSTTEELIFHLKDMHCVDMGVERSVDQESGSERPCKRAKLQKASGSETIFKKEQEDSNGLGIVGNVTWKWV